MAEAQRRRPLKQARLQQLATEAGLPIRPTTVCEEAAAVTFLQESHLSQAKEVLEWRRTWDGYKPPVASLSKSKEPSFGYDEINRAIKAAINEKGAPGLVEALLDIAASNKSSFWGQVRGKAQQVSWGDFLTGAILNHCHDMLRLLASRADEKSLNSVLPTAIREQDILATRILLERGADLADYHADFMSVMLGTNTPMQELLICAPRPPCHKCRSDALVVASQVGSLPLVSLLSQRGVDADASDWAAMRSAIKSRRQDILLAILSGPRPPSPQSLDAALALAYSTFGSDTDFMMKVAEMLLCAGAQGEGAATVLVSAARSVQLEIVDLLIRYGASVDYQDGEAMRIAVVDKNRQLLSRLMRGKPAIATLSAVLASTQAALLEDVKYGKDILGTLLSAGLRGDALDDFLYQIVQAACAPATPNPESYEDYLGIIRMFMDGDYANINFGGAAALRVAAGTATLDVLRLLLGKPPNDSSLNAAFFETSKISIDNSSRLDIIAALIDAGTNGVVVDQALAAAVQRGNAAVAEIRLLLRVAFVDYNQGAALMTAISRKELQILDILLEVHPSKATLVHIWDVATGIDDIGYQYEVFARLLKTDAAAAPLSRELVSAVSRGSDDKRILDLLLDNGAPVESDHGIAITTAVKSENIEALESLLARNPPPEALRAASQSTWRLSGDRRLQLARILLRYGLQQNDLDSGLLVTVDNDSPSMDLVGMLLDHGASPEGEAVIAVVQRGNPSLLALLVARVQTPAALRAALDALLHQYSLESEQELALLGILLSRGATSPSLDSALLRSCAAYNMPACQLLLDHVNSAEIVTEALRTIITQSPSWQTTAGLALVETLLNRGANRTILGPALIQAASMFNLPAVMLLRNYVRDPAIYTMAWSEATLTNVDWLGSNLPVLEILLNSSGARVDVNFALGQAAAFSGETPGLVALVDVLLRHGADPNRNGSHPLRLAARNGSPETIRILCERSHTELTLWLSCMDVLKGAAQGDPQRILACVRALMECPSARLDLSAVTEGPDPPLIQALTTHAHSPDLIRCLVAAGADVMSSAICPLLIVGPGDWRCVGHENGSAGLRISERVPALLWALMRDKTELGDDVIEALIDLGADVNFATPHLRFTPLILAAKHNRPGIIAKLLQCGAIRDERDNFQHTALLYASRHGFDDCVKILLWQNTAINDGSLHEAARGFHATTVTLLCQAGHDPNFTPETRGNHTALGEVCLLANATDEAALDQTLRALATAGADPLRKSDGSLPLVLAMANRDPLPMVLKVMEVLMPGNIAGPEVVVQLGDLVYSPTMYLKKLILPAGRARRPPTSGRVFSAGSYFNDNNPYPVDTTLEIDDPTAVSRAFHIAAPTVYNEILSILTRQGAVDRFYYTGTQHVQPADMIGAPRAITARETARRDRLAGRPANPAAFRYEQAPLRSADNDELHMWGAGAGTAASDAQWRAAEERRQVDDRRALAERVDAHLAAQAGLRQEAVRMRAQAAEKARLDQQGWLSEWLAGQLALADRLGVGRSLHEVQAELWRRKEVETRGALEQARGRRVEELERAKEAMFGEVELAVARRVVLPGGHEEGDFRGRQIEREGSRSPASRTVSADMALLSLGRS